MKRVNIMKVGLIAAIIVLLLCISFPGHLSSPFTGKLKAVTVTKRTAGGEQTIHIQKAEKVAAIERSLRRVWKHLPANSLEGYPKYRMEVDYTDGKKETFIFTETEWGSSGFTPDALLQELAKNGL